MKNKIAFAFALNLFLGTLAYFIPWVVLADYAPLLLRTLLTIAVILAIIALDINIIRERG